MRVGMNPNRLKQVKSYPHIVASAITYLPNMEGYHEHRFGVIKKSLETMRERAGVDCAVMIWDNGSCQDLLDWIMYEYKPDFLMQSPNVGKASARAGIVRSLPENTIVGVADDDMYYYQDWLSKSIELMEAFPGVAQVSGCPVRTQMRWGNSNTIRWARQNAILEAGRFISDKHDYDFCTSIGRDYDWHVRYTENDQDYRITYNDHQAYAVAHHCQWIGYAGIMKDFCLHDGDAMGDEKPFDNAIDQAGYLRLTTCERYTRHIGNILEKDMV